MLFATPVSRNVELTFSYLHELLLSLFVALVLIGMILERQLPECPLHITSLRRPVYTKDLIVILPRRAQVHTDDCVGGNQQHNVVTPHGACLKPHIKHHVNTVIFNTQENFDIG